MRAAPCATVTMLTMLTMLLRPSPVAWSLRCVEPLACGMLRTVHDHAPRPIRGSMVTMVTMVASCPWQA
eukprot:1784979-Alexandrium_andersonii.AAC.1